MSVTISDLPSLLISIVALISSIALPLYLAKRAEKFSARQRAKDKLSPFYRKVKEFTVHTNTPGIGFRAHDLYYLSNEAAELGQEDIQKILLIMFNDIVKRDGLPFFEEGTNNVNPEVSRLGQKFQRDLKKLHDLVESKNASIHS